MTNKRKRTKQSIFTKKKRKGSDFSKAFFGTLGDPIGTIISLIRKQPPSWARNNRLSPAALRYERKLENFRNRHRYARSMPYFPPTPIVSVPNSPFGTAFGRSIRRSRIFDMRKGNLIDFFAKIITNPSFQSFGKKALISVGSSAIPAAISWAAKKIKRKNKQNELLSEY